MAEHSWDPDPILRLQAKSLSLRTHRHLLLPFVPRRPGRDGGLLLILAPPSRLSASWGELGPQALICSQGPARSFQSSLWAGDFEKGCVAERSALRDSQPCPEGLLPPPSLPGCRRKGSNSISVRAFLDEGDDVSLEEVKNRQNTARNNTPPTVGACRDLGCSTLPSEEKTDRIEASAPASPHSSRNGFCGPPSGGRTLGGARPEALSAAGTLTSPVSGLTAEFGKLGLQTRSRCPEAPNHTVQTGDEEAPTSVDAVERDLLGPPDADRLGNNQIRTDSDMSAGIAHTCLSPSSPGREALHGGSSVSAEPVQRLFLSGYELGGEGVLAGDTGR